MPYICQSWKGHAGHPVQLRQAASFLTELNWLVAVLAVLTVFRRIAGRPLLRLWSDMMAFGGAWGAPRPNVNAGRGATCPAQYLHFGTVNRNTVRTHHVESDHEMFAVMVIVKWHRRRLDTISSMMYCFD